MRESGSGTTVIGSGLDTNYDLAQCYGDLSSLECVLCYVEARTVLPQCSPPNGGRIFLDGCFMRTENYSFFEEYRGPDDMAVCGNTRRKGSIFRESVRQVVTYEVAATLKNEGYAKARVAASSTNDSTYALVNCWRTLNNTSCKSCLENALASILGCLPWSEGRALNIDCFISNLNFKYSTLERATRSFNDVNKLGQGRFGTIYKLVVILFLGTPQLFFGIRPVFDGLRFVLLHAGSST
ncbi:hypothetical protein V6N11_050150 [Hibiscus sabdariffa]|uniref:Gnk2-homologous domain-containing protein n=1 Tax=Hibiscus sabdariffa TaxID=183260 RepID=A0ABR2T8Z8_9ROSI